MVPSSSRKTAPLRNQTVETVVKQYESNSCQVRVCVRVRPISATEQENGTSKVLDVTSATVIQLPGRRFTFDSVFDEATSQCDLYQHVAPSLMQSFLDGFNATIIAYGQTGSGKTYTMGSEAHTEIELLPSTGLIPRFLQDLFDQLSRQGEEYRLETTFLEVYGDDIHDLLGLSRTVLPIREDSGGGVVCAGLTVRPITSAAEAVQVLHEGTLNRSTAATRMNLTSSRSHAVFTVSLKRQGVASKLTFVDLAGSERMKKTGAEGERAREGIQINKGLLALGNVINALADEERMLSGGKKNHVPYRENKLTRLLQDALGGNSQTVFMACVSSSDTNVSETLNTLQYANRARNIQNAPIRNVEYSTEQNQRWKAYANVLEAELVSHKFGLSDTAMSPIGDVNNLLMKQNDVIGYLTKLRELANDCSQTNAKKSMEITHSKAPLSSQDLIEEYTLAQSIDTNKSIMWNSDSALLAEVNPDAELAILDQLLELQQQDQDFDQEQKKDVEELKRVEGELVEKEHLLLHLRDSLKVYHSMKAKYESLIVEVQTLEREKIELADQLEKASCDPASGCSRAIKKEIEVVERSLARARNETRRHRQMYMKAEQEAKKCHTLEHKIHEMKQGRVNLIKKQREAASRHREMTESKTKEIMALKRKDRNAERKMSKLESEIRLHKRNLDNRQAYCKKLMEQKKQTESHLVKLLAMRQRKLRERTHFGAVRRDSVSAVSLTIAPKQVDIFADADEEVESIVFLLDKTIDESVSHSELQNKYEMRFNVYSDLMRQIVTAVKSMEDSNNDDRQDLVHAIRELEIKIEIAEADMEKSRIQLSQIVGDSDDLFYSSIKTLISEKPSPILRTIMVGFMKKMAEGEIQRRQLTSTLTMKESVVTSFGTEVDSLHNNIAALKRELLHRYLTISKYGCNEQKTIEELSRDISALSLEVEMSHQENTLLSLISKDFVRDIESVVLELNETKEKLTIAEAVMLQNGGVQVPEQILERLQTLWSELGITSSEREKLRRRIENCLTDTCSNLLDNAQAMKERTEGEIANTRQEISRISSSLKLNLQDFSSTSQSLLQQLDEFRLYKLHLNPIFENAMKRREAVVAKATEISCVLGIPKESLDKNLILLLDGAAASKEGNVLGDLSDEFLLNSEKAVVDLQVEKSRILASNSGIQKESLSMVNEMSFNGKDVVSLVCRSLQRRLSSLPPWWDKQTLEMVSRSVTTVGGVVRSSRQFSHHLTIVHESLLTLAAGRRQLSNKLRSIIMQTQKTLLKTVNREFDAISAHSILNDELSRLPRLSKEFIHACFAEVESLCTVVDTMSQSEIEALTVVYEALNVSPSNRAKFWNDIDKSLHDTRGENIGPFDDIRSLSRADGEEWLLSTINKGTKSYVELEARLFKLEKIHAEVEQLRDRQDSKSKIISLDAEVRILSAQLKDFEDEKCSKHRLVSKKTTSSSLLKEERFRKQMQSKFSSKLDQLVSLLKAWNENVNSLPDQELLSDDVKTILKNSDRKEFMHLRTVEYKSSSKRPADAQLLVVASSSIPMKRQKTSSRTVNMQVKDNDQKKYYKQSSSLVLSPVRDGSRNGVSTTSSIMKAKTESSISVTSNSVTFPTGKKKPVLDPFGNVLAKAMSPHPQVDKENSYS